MSSSKPSLSQRVLRIPRSDDPQSYVLLQVSRVTSAPLDLDIVATEGENPYTGSVRQNRLNALRGKNYQGSDHEWEQIMSYVFGQLQESTKIPDLLSGIESSANILGSGDEDRELVITIRKRVQSITQRLGSVNLRQDDEQAIELFDWSGTAVARADALEQRLSSLADRYRAAESTINQLNKQLEEFVNAKSQHDEQLMASFVQLLNEKKLKIRNQQRLLAAAVVDPKKVSEMQGAISAKSRVPSRNGRMAKRSARELSDNEESEDGFEEMEVDQTGQQDDRLDDEQPSTPQPLEDGEAATTDEEFPSPSIVKGREEGMQASNGHRTSGRASLAKSATPPPRRELPFVKRNTVDRNPIQTGVEPGEGDAARDTAEETAGETDDDEL